MPQSSLSLYAILIAILTYTIVCSGCSIRYDRPEASLSSSLANCVPTSSASKVYCAPCPNPFKLVTQNKDGQIEELWQDRGEPGLVGGVLKLSLSGNGPRTFNPWNATDVDSAGLGSLMFETLLDIDPWTSKPYPRLAKSIHVSADKCEYTIILRKGLTWSDGHPLNADDVVFTFATLIARGYGNSSMRDTLSVKGEFPSVKKLDDLTVVFRTKVPFAPFLGSLRVPIAPKHIVEAVTKKPMSEFHSFWDTNCDPKTLVVSGPFTLVRHIPSQRLEMAPNPHYSYVDKLGRRLPYLARIIILIVPDITAEVLKFYGKEIDLLDIRMVRGVDAATIKRREKLGNYRLYNLGPDDGTRFLMFNLCRRKDPKTGKFYVDPIKQAWFNNDYFRQAISHAVDRKRMVNNTLRGVGYELFTAEPSVSPYFNRELPPFPQDLDLAALLLAKGGFRKIGSQLVDNAGHQVEFTLNSSAGNPVGDAICIMIKEDLEKLGMKVNYQPIDFNILIDKTNNSLNWECVLLGLTGSRLEPNDGANVWKSNGRLHMFDQRLPGSDGNIVVNDARPWEKEIDQCFDLSATTFDEKLRHKYFNRYQEIVYEKQPFIYLITVLDMSAVRNKIGNYMPTALGINYTPKGTMHNIEEIFIKPSP